MDKRIVIGSDGSGFELKEAVKEHLKEEGFEVTDLGTQSAQEPKPYYEVAHAIAPKISNGEFERGILICGTGMGMSIVANKYPHVYAAVCENTYAAMKSRAINNANVLTMGGWITGSFTGCDIADTFLKTEFLENLEDWRQKNLTKAFATVQEYEQEIYNKGMKI